MSRRSIRLALAGALLLVARSAEAAASIWLQKGVSGFGVSTGFGSAFGYSGGSDSLSLTLGGGYSYEGVYELGLQVVRGFPHTVQPGDVSVATWTIAPTIEVHPLKQSATVPISLGLRANVAFPFFSSQELDAQGVKVSAFGYGFAAMLYRFFRLGESVGVTPAVAFGFTRMNTTFEAPTGPIDHGESIYDGALGAYFAFLDSGGRIWGLVPSVDITGNYVQASLTVGVVFAMP